MSGELIIVSIFFPLLKTLKVSFGYEMFPAFTMIVAYYDTLGTLTGFYEFLYKLLADRFSDNFLLPSWAESFESPRAVRFILLPTTLLFSFSNT